MSFYKFIQEDPENLFVQKVKENINMCYELIKKSETKRNILMQKHYSINNKIEEMTELIGNPEHQEIKKLE
jgi:arginine utilization protein RocB